MLSPSAVAEESNPVCGDRLRLYLQVAKRQIQAASFLAYGCPPSIACGSALTELLHGKTIDEASLITKQEIVDAVGGLPSRKHHAAALAIETLRAALKKMS
jgi:NifU-like protein involved in Fe-S cluster formation